MLEAYFDESGSHGDSAICTLAGYFGGERHWKRFDSEWRAILKQYGISEFHAKKFWARDKQAKLVGEYKNWDNEKAQRFLSELLTIISSHRIYPIGASVVMAEWGKLSHDERRFATGGIYERHKFITSGAPNKTYFLPFLFGIQKVCDYCNDGHRVHFFFDRNDPYSGYALEYYKLVAEQKLKCSPKLGDIDFPASISATPIQAADLLAYQVYRYAKEKLAKNADKLPTSETLSAALCKIRSVKNDFKLFDKYGLDLMLGKFRRSKQ